MLFHMNLITHHCHHVLSRLLYKIAKQVDSFSDIVYCNDFGLSLQATTCLGAGEIGIVLPVAPDLFN